MALITDIAEGARVSFEVYPDAYLANEFKDVTNEGVVTPAVARKLGFDLDAAHQNVYPVLVAAGVSVPNDPRQYNYVYVTFSNGESTFVGVPWIRPGTVISSDGMTLGLVFQNRDDRRRRRILEALSSINETPDAQTWE
ncbi:hypothetical protein MZD04_gp045 [Pseudomonas phage Psa21]|uniref:SH3 fold domain-containing protein n=1 Tax=Pseudomonas phage Psa21 TaxID=2530023 RepID=A0A481W527_9CAUD|nr:hypothetical protein MZD04_gp045 [Pseudomonas phage Psa21]QBJ02575.1 hypothetical protein PSA21_45 [Pseudomonas phage Psa21]